MKLPSYLVFGTCDMLHDLKQKVTKSGGECVITVIQRPNEKNDKTKKNKGNNSLTRFDISVGDIAIMTGLQGHQLRNEIYQVLIVSQVQKKKYVFG